MSSVSENIRQARAGDSAEVYRLSRMFTPDLGLGAEDFEENFQMLVNDSNWFICVAESGRGLSGYAAAQDYGPGLRTPFTVGRLHDLFVEPGTRRSGLGKKMVEEVFQAEFNANDLGLAGHRGIDFLLRVLWIGSRLCRRLSAVPGIHARSASKGLVIAQERGTMKSHRSPLIVKIFTWLRWR